MSIPMIVTGTLFSATLLLSSAAYGGDFLSPLAAGYLERGREMTASGNYIGAVDQLRRLVTDDTRLDADDTRELAYLLAMAAYGRGEDDCISLLTGFIGHYPSSIEALEASLALGDAYLYEKRFADALDQYNTIDFLRLNPAQYPLYTYRKAFCLIKCGQFEAARPLLRSIGKARGYEAVSEFYLAYIDYAEGEYGRAYDRFVSASKMLDTFPPAQDDWRNASLYQPIGLEADYYIAHIEYYRRNYDRTIALGKQLLSRMPKGDSTLAELVPELEKVMGLSYFKLGDYGDARRYLAEYFSGIRDASAPNFAGASDDAVYVMGVLEYVDGDYEAASRLFSSISELRDDLGQSASLYLGQIAAREGDDNAAAIAFERAAERVYDREVGETALYDYVASRTRGGNIPFSSSISLLERFLEQYPGSEYVPAVEEYLATAYYNERDYAKALESIRRIKNPGRDVLAAKQKVTYELGMECMVNNRPQDAETYLEEAISLAKISPEIAREARLWLGDALYSQRKWNAAEKVYKRFIDETGKSENRSLALYNLAYSLYMQDRFKEAAGYFTKAIDATPAIPERLHADARIRLADCRYYTGDYRTAMQGYAEASKNAGQDADYAAYRHAVMRGLSGDINGKIAELDALPSKYPGSKWLPAALLEKGMTYSGLGKTAEATRAFERLTSLYPSSPYARKGMLNLAISYNKADKGEEASGVYREVIRNWPSSEEASLANEDLRRYYAATGDLDEYSDFLSSIPDAPRMDNDEKERLSFEAAEALFAKDVKAFSRLEEYTRKYPNGRYLAQALLDLAEGYEAAGRKEEALTALDNLLSRRGDSPQAPEALAMKANILESSYRRDEALRAWRNLENLADTDFLPDAYAGIMRTTDSEQERVRYARLALQSGGLTADMAEEASLYEALGLRDSGDTRGAASILSRLAENTKSEAGARAAVELGLMQLDSRQYKEAEKTLTAFTDAGTPHQYWLARGFIALADTYHASGKTYLAKEYISSLRDNYPGDELDIHDMISKRLKEWK